VAVGAADACDCFQQQGDEVLFGCSCRQQQVLLPGPGDQFPCGSEDAVAPAFDVPEPGRVRGGKAAELEPADEVRGQRRDVDQAWLAAKEAKGNLPRPVFFRVLIRFSALPRARWRAYRWGPCQRGEIVRNAVIRFSSTSSSVRCAPACRGSARRNRFVPGG
jgi:hypothetical protein